MLSSCISPKACRSNLMLTFNCTTGVSKHNFGCTFVFHSLFDHCLHIPVSNDLWSTFSFLTNLHRWRSFCWISQESSICVFWGSHAAGTPSPWRKALWAADSQCSALGHAALLSVILPKTLCVSVYDQYHANPTEAGGLAPVDPVTDSSHVHLLCS